MARHHSPTSPAALAQQQRDQRNLRMLLDSVRWNMAMASPGQKQQLDEAAVSLQALQWPGL